MVAEFHEARAGSSPHAARPRQRAPSLVLLLIAMSQPVTWAFPTTIVFGAGVVAQIAERVKALGASRALVVCDPGVVKAGIAGRVKELLEAGGVAAALFDGVEPNPVEKNVHDGVAAYRAHQAACIVSVGGGSPLDTGKLIALKVTHERPLADYDDAADGWRHVSANVPPTITIPTTAGTGSEVGRSGVVTLAATGRKTVIFSPHLLAKVALLDPELTRSMPARVTAATGFDALTHCLEAYCSLGDHPMADAIALGGLELCAKHLARAVEQGSDLDARGGMMKAAMMGAVAFQKGLGACHSLAHPLSSEKGLHHGLANALCLPAVIDFNESAAHDRLERVRAILDPAAKSCAAAIRALRARVGLPAGLGAEGVTEADVPKLSDKALADACHQSNPRKTTRDDLAALYRASL
jgi:alcohol dehydrogenase class IV